MVAIFTGAGAGFEKGSGYLLGGVGMLGSGTLGRSGQGVSVNARTGNLLITQQDEFLVGRGLDLGISRTYNSLAELADGDNGDNWQQSSWRRVYGLTGTLNTAGSTVSRQSADGSAIVYNYKTIDGVTAYWTTDGAGAHDKLVKSGATWIWTDGSSQVTETYEATVADAASFRIKEQTDTDGYKLGFAYVAGTDKLYRVTTANNGTANASTGIAEQSYIEYAWSGNTITQIVTGYTDYGDLSTLADNINKVLTRTWYDYSGGKLVRVRTDLTPSDNILPSLADSYWTQYGYDANGRVNSITEKDGASLTIVYDGSGRVATLTQTVASGDTRVTGFTYDLHDAGDPANINYTSVTGADGQVTKLYADEKGQLRKVTAPPAYAGAAAQSVAFGYDPDGNVTSVTDAAGKVRSYTFDLRGNSLSSTDPLSNVVTRTYGTKNELLTETRTGSDASGAAVAHTTRYAYDGENHLRYMVSAEGMVTEYRYTGTGLLQYVIEYPEQSHPIGSGALSEATLNAWRDLIPDRSSTKVHLNGYDARGNLYYAIDYGAANAAGVEVSAEGYTRVYTSYDQNGRLLNRMSQGENAETFLYDGMGRLIGSTDLAGGTTTIVFNDTATTTTITTASAETIVRTYNKAGELLSETSSGGYDVSGTASYKYDKNGRVRMATDESGRNSYFLYDKTGLKIADIGHDGQIVEYRYDAAGRVAATVRYTDVVSAGNLATLANPDNTLEMASIRPGAHSYDIWNWSIYDSAGRLIEAIDGGGGVATFEYDQSDQLIRTVSYFNKLAVAGFKTTPPTALVLPSANAADTVSRTFYDADGRLIGALDGEGYLTEIVYDKAGQKIEEVAYAAKTNSSHWASGSFATLRGTAAPASTANRRVRHVYDGRGLLRYTVDTAGFATAHSYNYAGKLTKTVVHAAAISTADFTYDNVKSLVTAIANPANDRTSTLTYNAAGQVASTVDVAGLSTGYTYNTAGQVVKKVEGNGGGARTTRYWYTARGDLRYTVDAEGYVKRFDYNASSQLTREVSWANRVTATDATTIADIATLSGSAGTWADVNYTYDTLGRRNAVTDGVGNMTVSTWYSNGTLSSVYAAYGTPDQSRTLYVYDGAGRLIGEYGAHGEAEQSLTVYAYDGLGNITSRTDGNNKTSTYTYDERGLRLSKTDAAGGVVTYEYDGFGQVVKVTDPRLNSSYSYYNNLGQLVRSRDAESYVTDMTYTAFGQLASMTRYYTRTVSAGSTTTLPAVTTHANDATTSYTYDKRGLVTSEIDAHNVAQTSSYDAFGNLVSVVNRIGGETQYTYDKRGQALTERVRHFSNNNAADWVTNSFAYDSRGNLITRVEGDGLRTTGYVYDKANRLIEVTGQAFQGITPRSYFAYDARGQVTRATDPTGAKTLYFYDDLGRVVVEIGPDGAYTKRIYDKAGNVIETRDYETLVALPADGGSEEEAPAAPAGNYRVATLGYDNINRLLGHSLSGAKTGYWNGSTWVSATTPIATGFQYDANGNVTVETDPNGNTIWRYYDKLGRKVTEVDGERYRTDWTYDVEGRVLSETRYANQAAAPSSTTVPPSVTANATLDRVTNYTYDKLGNRKTEQRMGVLVHNGSGGTTSTNALVRYFYNALGLLTQKDEATDAGELGVVGDESIYYGYDLAGRILTERRGAYVAADGTTVTPLIQYNYNGLDNLVSTSQLGSGDAATRTTTYAYSGDKLISSTDASGFVRNYKYDAAGRVTHNYYTRMKSDGTAAAAYEGMLTTYDTAGRVAEQWLATSANGTSWTAAGTVVSTRYNAYGEVSKIGVNAAGVAEASRMWQQQNQYDAVGRLWATSAGDGVWKYLGYDKNGNQTVAITSAGADLSGKTFDQALALVGNANINATYSVFDKRSLTTSVVEEGRELGGSVQTLTTSRTYNAFGEVATETNALGAAIAYTYNNMGRMIRSESPTVQITLENGGSLWVRPSEDYYYDAAGRLVATRDANGSYAAGGTSASGTSKAANTGNLTRRTLLAGTGYGKGEALVASETYADGGVKQTKYDIHGDARTLIDEIGQQTTQVFDAMGRVTQITRPGGLIESFGYDGLGQRIQAWNNLYQTPIYGPPEEVWVEDPPYWNAYDQAWEYGNGHYEWQTPIIGYTPDKARTDYDTMGRVVSTRAFGGDVITTGYTWDATIGASGTGLTSGGWTEVTTYYVNETTATGKSSTQKTDLFDRVTWKSDLGAHVSTYAYDFAGRRVSMTLGGMTNSYTYYNTGQAATITNGSVNAGQVNTNWTRDVATYSYDKVGNRLSEVLTREQGVYTAGYMFYYNPYEPEWMPESYDVYSETIKNQSATYDALGRMRTWGEAGTAKSPAASIAQEYDANSNIRRTQTSYYTLDAVGATSYQSVTDHWFRFDSMNRLVTDRGMLTGVAGAAGTTIARGSGAYGMGGGRDIQYDLAGRRVALLSTEAYYDGYGGYTGETTTTETYQYNAQGLLWRVHGNTGAGAKLRSQFGYDLLGHQTSQSDYDAAGTTVLFSRGAAYNTKGQMTSDSSWTKKTDNKIYSSSTSYYYTAYSGGAYQLGSVAWSQSTNSVTGSSSTTSRTINTFVFYDSALQSGISYDSDVNSGSNPIWNTGFAYNGLAQLVQISITDGKPRSVSFTNDELGQIIRRDETRPSNAPSSQTGSPHEVWYRYNGRQLGYTGNNGTNDLAMSASIADRQVVAPTNQGTFRNSQYYGSTYAEFAASYNPINSYGQGSSTGSYTVLAGDTLASIAQGLYGDSSLWYKVAEANGLTAASALLEGQILTLPAGVIRNAHNAGTDKPYDPADVIGDVSPTTAPKPPKKGKNCGVIGQIIATIVAVAASYFLGPILGNVVSQGFNNLIGIQKGFSWKSLAISVISAGVTAGLEGAFSGIQNAFVRGALQGATANALTQGIAVATRLQSKFDFVAVAAAGAAGGVSSFVGSKIGGSGQSWDAQAGAWVRTAAPSLLNVAVSGTAGAIADAATRSSLTGGSFGDTLMANLPTLIGTIAGQALARGIDVDGDGQIGRSKQDPNGLGPVYNEITDPSRDYDYRGVRPPPGSFADIVGKINAAPFTLVGAVLGLVNLGVGLVVGNKVEIRFRDNSIQFIGGGIGQSTNTGGFTVGRASGVAGALTLGNVQLYSGSAHPDTVETGYATPYAMFNNIRGVRVGDHEEAHTYQYQRLGIYFLQFYLPHGIQSSSNPFEGAAERGARGGSPYPDDILRRGW